MGSTYKIIYLEQNTFQRTFAPSLQAVRYFAPFHINNKSLFVLAHHFNTTLHHGIYRIMFHGP